MAMMFRGVGKPTDQLNIQLAQPSDSAFGRYGDYAPAVPPMSQVPASAAVPGKPKFGWAEAIGTLGDVLASAGGGQATFLPAMQQHQDGQEGDERHATPCQISVRDEHEPCQQQHIAKIEDRDVEPARHPREREQCRGRLLSADRQQHGERQD